MVIMKPRGKVVFTDVFCGAYFTFAVSKEGHVYGFGLSNYHQLGKLLPHSLRHLNTLPVAVLNLLLLFLILQALKAQTLALFQSSSLLSRTLPPPGWVSQGDNTTLCV